VSEEPIVLLPSGSQWDSRRRKLRYEGSSLRVVDGRLEWTGPPRGPADWRLDIGRGLGQAAKLVRVIAVFNDSTSLTTSTRLDRYAVLGADGVMLAWFASTVDARPFPDALAWFPEPAVERFARKSGLDFGTEVIDSAKELGDRFPGLYGRNALAVAMEYLVSVAFIAGGTALFVLPFYADEQSPDGGTAVMTVVISVVGLAIGIVGLLLFPDVYRRIPRRNDPSLEDSSNGGEREV
jgi:hypothetical protein